MKLHENCDDRGQQRSSDWLPSADDASASNYRSSADSQQTSIGSQSTAETGIVVTMNVSSWPRYELNPLSVGDLHQLCGMEQCTFSQTCIRSVV